MPKFSVDAPKSRVIKALIGRGLGFGIHEALDQIGAIIGPLIFSAVFIFEGGYHKRFNILWIPALLCVATLLVARIKFSSPEKLETSGEPTGQNIQGKGRLPFRVFNLSCFSDNSFLFHIGK